MYPSNQTISGRCRVSYNRHILAIPRKLRGADTLLIKVSLGIWGRDMIYFAPLSAGRKMNGIGQEGKGRAKQI